MNMIKVMLEDQTYQHLIRELSEIQIREIKEGTWYVEEIKQVKAKMKARYESLKDKKRFIIEVFLNDKRLEYRAFDNEMDANEELTELKKAYKDSNCIFYQGELTISKI
jgi:hypothetical protein